MFIAQPRHFLGANRTPCWVVGVPDPPTPQTKPVELVGGEMDRQWAVTMLIYNLRHNGFQFEIPAGHRRERENHLQMCGIENHQLIRQPRSSHRQLKRKFRHCRAYRHVHVHGFGFSVNAQFARLSVNAEHGSGPCAKRQHVIVRPTEWR